MLIFLLRGGKLPWQNIDARDDSHEYRAILDMKMSLSPEELCEGLPHQFAEYMQEVKAIPRCEEPDYRSLQRKFWELATEQAIEYDWVFDWSVLAYLEEKQKELAQSTKEHSKSSRIPNDVPRGHVTA